MCYYGSLMHTFINRKGSVQVRGEQTHPLAKGEVGYG